MRLPGIDPLIDVAARRCWVPDNLETVTDHAPTDPGDETADRIWANVESLYRSGVHPGVQVCIRHRGEVVVDRAIGHAHGNTPGRRPDPAELVPMTVRTPVNLFSAAKAVTAMLMHRLEEKGAFALDDRVADHLPGFERHGKHEITIRQVLTHRAGIPGWPSHAYDLDLLTDPELAEEVVCDLRPHAEIGGAPAYHAISGGFIMEFVARRTTGSSLRDLLATEIKNPLGLEWFDYGVPIDDTDAVAANVVTGLRLGPALGFFFRRILGTSWGRVIEMSNDPRFLSGVIPSGNVIVTARDAALFYQCLLDGGTLDGTRVFEEKTVEKAIEAEHDELGVDRRLFLPIRYGAGFMLGSETISINGWNHPKTFGHVGLSNLFTWADPDRDLVVAVLTTGKPVIGPHVVPMVQLFAGINELFPASN